MPNPAEGEKVTIDASGEPKGGAQRRALDIIAAAVVDGTGFVALTGPAGAGKTAVLRAAAELLDHPPIQVIRIDANGAPLTLPRLIGQIAGARQQGDPMARIERAQSRLLRPAAPYERTILMVDDAHELHEDALVYLQLTSRSKVHVERSLQIVFAGEPRFWSLLDNAFLMPLRTRISFRAALDDPTISPDSAHTENAALDSDGNMREDEDIAPSLPSTRPSETSIVASDSALLAGLELIALPRTRGRVRRYGWASLTAMVIVVSAGPNTNETAGLEAVAGPSSPFAELPVISGASRAENQHATVQQSLAMIPGAAPITVGAGDTPVSGYCSGPGGGARRAFRTGGHDPGTARRCRCRARTHPAPTGHDERDFSRRVSAGSGRKPSGPAGSRHRNAMGRGRAFPADRSRCPQHRGNPARHLAENRNGACRSGPCRRGGRAEHRIVCSRSPGDGTADRGSVRYSGRSAGVVDAGSSPLGRDLRRLREQGRAGRGGNIGRSDGTDAGRKPPGLSNSRCGPASCR